MGSYITVLFLVSSNTFSSARPSDGDVATCVNGCLHRFPLMTNNYAGPGIVVGNWVYFLYTLTAFLFACLRQLQTLLQTVSAIFSEGFTETLGTGVYFQ